MECIARGAVDMSRRAHRCEPRSDPLRRSCSRQRCSFAVGAASAATFTNPIVAASPDFGSADPSLVRHRGYYYYCRSLADREIGVARARRLQDIGAAPMTTVFRSAANAPYAREVWAPELQRVRGRW